MSVKETKPPLSPFTRMAITHLSSAAADAIKTAGAQAYAAWLNCTEEERKQRPPS